MTAEDKDFFYTAGMVILMILCAIFLSALAKAQDIHHHPGMSDDVDKFYSTWLMPDQRSEDHRVNSCCNRKDCHPAIIRYNEKLGRWEGRFAEGIIYQRDFWLPIPDGKLEENYNDARESPDGQSHMCGSSMHVYCAVRGGGA